MPGPERPLNYPHSISFKVTDEQLQRALALRDTFRWGTWAEVGRWLFDDPDVGEIIAKRVRATEIDKASTNGAAP